MACGITGDYIDQMLTAAENSSMRCSRLFCPILAPEIDLNEPEARGDQEEVKGGTQGG